MVPGAVPRCQRAVRLISPFYKGRCSARILLPSPLLPSSRGLMVGGRQFGSIHPKMINYSKAFWKVVNSLAPPLYGINQCCLLLQTLQSLTITTVAVCRAASLAQPYSYSWESWKFLLKNVVLTKTCEWDAGAGSCLYCCCSVLSLIDGGKGVRACSAGTVTPVKGVSAGLAP